MASLKLRKAASIALKDYLSLEEEETLLVICEDSTEHIGNAFYDACQKFGARCFVMRSHWPGEELYTMPPILTEAMKFSDVVVFSTTQYGIQNAQSVKEITFQGTRIAFMPSVSEESLIRVMTADHDQLQKFTDKAFDLFSQTAIMRIESPDGSDISFQLKERNFYQNTGIIKKIGSSSTIPGGVLYSSPWEDKTSGVVVINGAVEGYGVVKNPIRLEIVDGFVEKITGDGDDAKSLAKILNNGGDNGRAVAEVGVGTNPSAEMCGEIFEDRSVYGSAYIGFGSNMMFGGTLDAPQTIKCVIKNATVYIDDEPFIVNGKYTIEEEN